MRTFFELAFAVADIPLLWQGQDETEMAVYTQTGQVLVKVNPQLYCPVELDLLIGDARKAQQQLGWQAHTALESICEMMVQQDVARNQRIVTY